jgi:HK97 family phage portal protein
MIFERFLHSIRNLAPKEVLSLPELIESFGMSSSAGQTVTAEKSKTVATAYRCINVLSDDVAKMPMQTFITRRPGQIERMRPASALPVQNIAWLLEISPNRNMTPFIFKKTLMQWLISWGDAYAWQPARRPGQRREIFVLNSSATWPFYDPDGNIWYQTTFSNGETHYLPDVELLHLLINSLDGITGRSVITYARESLGRQLGAYQTEGKFFKQGLNPSGLLWSSGELSLEARNKVRDALEESMSGSENAYRLAILDNKFSKFEPLTMKAVDMQFLQSIEATDREIANFFGMPLYKLNMGKEAYASNEQQNLDYLSTTLDPYLVQLEQEAALKWLSEDEQNYTYFRCNRDTLLRTDAKTRAEVIEKRIQSGVLTPNEGRQIDDLSAYAGGDSFYMPANIMSIPSNGGNPQQTGGNNQPKGPGGS